MKLGNLLISAIPYGLVALFAVAQSRMPSMNDVALHAPRFPNEATGEVWEIAFRGGTVRYVTHADYLSYWAPFVMIPVFMIAILWIMRDWYRAGLIDPFRERE